MSEISRRSLLHAAAAAPTLAAAQPVRPLKIVSSSAFTPEEIAEITAAAAPFVRLNFVLTNSRDQFRAEIRDAEVVYGGLSPADLDFAPNLKWWQAGGAGMDTTPPQLWASPLIITNMARVFAPGIAETAIGLLLALTRRIGTDYARAFARREWKTLGSPRSADHTELAGRTMAVVGLGGIGSEIARRAHYGFGMKILATDAKPLPTPSFVDELHDPAWFPTMVPRADVLVSAAPLTPKTARMFNERVFRAMKPTSYFLGISRGGLFDGDALIRALKENWIAGAGLDVWPEEPIPSSSAIFDCTNVVITPHTSGWGPDRQRRLVSFFAENVRRYAAGIPMLNIVDKKEHY